MIYSLSSSLVYTFLHQCISCVSKLFIVIVKLSQAHSSSATHTCVLLIYILLPRRVVFFTVNFIFILLRYKYIMIVNERSCVLYRFIPSFHYVFRYFYIKVSSLHSSTIICSIIIYNVYIIVCLFYHELWEHHLFIYFF